MPDTPDAMPQARQLYDLWDAIVDHDLGGSLSAPFDSVEVEMRSLFDRLNEAAASRSVLADALRNIQRVMGGETGTGGWDAPEDVWTMANEALRKAGENAYREDLNDE